MSRYWISNTLHFIYDGEELWGTIVEFGEGCVKLVTKQGLRYYDWDKMVDAIVYQCRVDEFIKKYQYHNDERFKHLYDYYGPYVQQNPWKQD